MPYCGQCKKECSVRVVDEGIGAYEFWGSRGVDSHKVVVSNCCDAEVFENKDCTIPYEYCAYEEDAELFWKEME